MQLFNNEKKRETELLEGFNVNMETKDPYGYWYVTIDGHKSVPELDGCFTDIESARIAIENAVKRLKSENKKGSRKMDALGGETGGVTI